MFVLNVDLWSADGLREVNLVRHSANSPNINCGTPASYAQIDITTTAFTNILPTSGPQPKYEPGIKYEGVSQQPYNPYPGQPTVNPGYSTTQSYQPSYPAVGFVPVTAAGVGTPQPYPTQQNGYTQPGPQPVFYATANQIHSAGAHGIDLGATAARAAEAQFASPRGIVSQTSPQGMYTRNLIGSLAASAFRLTDPSDKIGIWFVLQDLSVRTEGNFRFVLSLFFPPSPSLLSP